MFPGMNSGYMTYLVSTTASLPDFPRGGVSVRRRFRDFVVRPSIPICPDPACRLCCFFMKHLGHCQSLGPCQQTPFRSH